MLTPDARLFQLGYVVADLDQMLRDVLPDWGMPHLHMARGGPVRTGERRIGLAYRGDMMVEFIEPGDNPEALYQEALALAGAHPILHHLGYLVDDEGWSAVSSRVREMALPVDRHGRHERRMDFMYVDTRALCGHHVEYIRLLEDGAQVFAGAPRF